MSLDELSLPPLLLGTFCLSALPGFGQRKRPGYCQVCYSSQMNYSVPESPAEEGGKEREREGGSVGVGETEREEGEREGGQMTGRERGKEKGVRDRAVRRSSG